MRTHSTAFARFSLFSSDTWNDPCWNAGPLSSQFPPSTTAGVNRPLHVQSLRLAPSFSGLQTVADTQSGVQVPSSFVPKPSAEGSVAHSDSQC